MGVCPLSLCSGQGEQRGSWFNSGWPRLPANDPAAGGGGGSGGGGGGASGGGGSTGLFGLGGSHGTDAAFAGQGRTIGELSILRSSGAANRRDPAVHAQWILRSMQVRQHWGRGEKMVLQGMVLCRCQYLNSTIVLQARLTQPCRRACRRTRPMLPPCCRRRCTLLDRTSPAARRQRQPPRLAAATALSVAAQAPRLAAAAPAAAAAAAAGNWTQRQLAARRCRLGRRRPLQRRRAPLGQHAPAAAAAAAAPQTVRDAAGPDCM